MGHLAALLLSDKNPHVWAEDLPLDWMYWGSQLKVGLGSIVAMEFFIVAIARAQIRLMISSQTTTKCAECLDLQITTHIALANSRLDQYV
jgi:hypothetical protein